MGTPYRPTQKKGRSREDIFIAEVYQIDLESRWLCLWELMMVVVVEGGAVSVAAPHDRQLPPPRKQNAVVS